MTDLQRIISSFTNEIKIALPCQIVKLEGMYADIEPLIYNGLALPVIPDVPILFFGNKDKNIKFKSSVGDVITVFFTQIDLSNYLSRGIKGQVMSFENFNLTNAFALPFNFHTKKDNESLPINDFEIIGDVKITGSLTVTGDVVAGLTSLKNHIHSGVTTGGGVSGPPAV